MIGHCARCRKHGQLDKHHLIPRSRGGHDGPVAHLCLLCHRKVHDHTAMDWEKWILKHDETPPERPVEF